MTSPQPNCNFRVQGMKCLHYEQEKQVEVTFATMTMFVQDHLCKQMIIEKIENKRNLKVGIRKKILWIPILIKSGSLVDFYFSF